MRAIWIYANNDAPYDKLRANGITAPYYDIRDPRVTNAYLKAVRAEGFTPGVYACWNWLPGPYAGVAKGAEFARWVSGLLEPIAKGTAPDFPLVCLNIETHDVPYIRGALSKWRKLRPKRVTDWTLENHQGGLFNPASVLHVVASVRYTCPQFYEGAMRPVAGLESARDLADAGFPWATLYGFYDATALPDWWQGYAFGSLP